MAAFDEDGARAHGENVLGGASHVLHGEDLDSGEGFGFGEVRGYERGAREEFVAKGSDGVGREEGVAMLADHDGIDDEREGEAFRQSRNG